MMPSLSRFLLLAVVFLGGLVPAFGVTPRLFMKFDGTTTDSSGANIITTITPNFTPTYAADRNGVANKAIVFTGSQSIQLIASSAVGNSNQALGLRNGLTNLSFTLASWVYFTSIGTGEGYSTIFGNTASGAGTLHAGAGSGTALAHFGFDGSDANGATASMVTGQWYHLAFVYNGATQEQRIYINGMPEVVRSGVTNTLRSANLYLGNWGGTGTDPTNDLKGRLDDTVVYNVALDAGQVQALFNNVDPAALPAAGTYSAPRLPGILGTTGLWGVREIKGYNLTGFSYSSLVDADRIARNYPLNAGGATMLDYQSPIINMRDAENGVSHYFSNDLNFGTDVVGVDDNNLLMIAKCAVRIPVEDDYTFGFRGDEGSRLRVLGKQFLSSTRLATANNLNPAHFGDGIYFNQATGDSATIGVVHLTPGDYNLELTYWEGIGGSSVEVFAARGAKTAVDGSFQLVGDTANGGLELVRDTDTLPQIPTFTVNGGSTLFVSGTPGNYTPANFTLAWVTNAVPTTLSIDQGIGSVAIPSGTLNVAAPGATTTYTMTAQNGADVTTKSVTVYVNSAPIINSFTASNTTVTTGTPVTLSWVTDGATSRTLNPGGFNVSGLSSKVVSPTVSTTYTLTATNASGSASQDILIQVGVGPVINSFTVADANPLFGAETALSWNVSNATSLSINQGVGAVGPPTIGTAAILPPQTTTYTLTATNAFTSSTASTTLNIATPIGVLSPGFTCRRVSANTAFPFTGLGYLDSAITLVGETVGGPHYLSESPAVGQPPTIATTVNFIDGTTDGEFTTGNSAFPGGTGNNFAMRVTATLVVNTPGEYIFFISSDDGSRLRIDGQDVIVDDGTHSPSSSSGRITLNNPTAQLELIYFNTTGTAELELGWIRPNLQWQLLGVITPAAPVVRGQVLLSEFVADNTTLLDEDATTPDWIEIWNSTAATVNLAGYYLTDDMAIPNKWALPAWTLGPDKYAIVFASSKNRAPAQAVAGQDNPGTLAQPHLHTNFNINKTTGALALTQDNGGGGYNTLTVFNPYPAQQQDVSYGSSDAEGYIGYMETPTPGQPNAVTVQGFVSDTKFDHPRGRYTTAFSLGITTATAGATIRYTTDGSEPSRTHGTIYTGPLTMTSTTVIRTLAYKTGWKATNIDTQTYLFIDDVVTQTAATATALGFPTGPIAPRNQVLRYGMTLGNVTAAGAGQGTLADLKTALTSAPTICMTTDVANLMDATSGIYANADKHGLFWERPTSIEYLNAAGGSEFQIDCGARTRGGYSRSPNNPKHAFHLFFRGSLYDGHLKYSLFGSSGASDFSQIDMRCEENYSWSFANDPQNSLMREEWSRASERDTGQPYARNGYFHLYINGLYWGIYNWEERTEADFGATYLGGNKDTIDTVKSIGSPSYNTEMTDGNFAAWESLYRQAIALKNDLTTEASRTARYMQMRGLNANGTPNATYPVLLDVDNLIDYLLVIFYDGSFDAPLSTFIGASNNWFGVRDRIGSRGFAFFAHDNEHGFDSVSDGRPYNRVGPWGTGTSANNWGQTEYGTRETLTNTFYTKSNPQYLHEMLAYSAEYRQRFADRVQRHFANGGALTTANALARVNALAAQVDPLIHAEAARWGSATLNKTSWLNAKNTITSYMNTGGIVPGTTTNFGAQTDGRTSLVVQQLRGYQDPITFAKPLAGAATLLAPTFSGQFGGAVANPYNFTIGNPNGGTGTLYYTTTGIDPRDIGGAVNATALTAASPIPVNLTTTTTVRARVYNSGTQTWSPLTEAQYLIGTLASAANLVVSKIHYNPLGSGNLTQFVELMNISGVTIDLTNVRFILGIQFTFPAGYLLAPGARVLIVRDMLAFNTAYPSVPAGQIVGIFANGTTLGTGGAHLQLVDAASAIIRDFTYDNKSPWPESPDNTGPALVLINPQTNPNHSLPANWRASYAVGGGPGFTDALAYSAWSANLGLTGGLNGDDDHDGSTNLAEYYLGTSPLDPAAVGRPTQSIQTLNIANVVADYLTLTFTRLLGRDDASASVQYTADLTAAWGAAIPVGTPTYNGNGTETLTYRYPVPVPAPPVSGTRQFLRLRITQP